MASGADAAGTRPGRPARLARAAGALLWRGGLGPGRGGVLDREEAALEQPWAAQVAVQARLEDLTQVQRDTLAEIRQAEAQLPYVSRWYFLNR